MAEVDRSKHDLLEFNSRLYDFVIRFDLLENIHFEFYAFQDCFLIRVK